MWQEVSLESQQPQKQISNAANLTDVIDCLLKFYYYYKSDDNHSLLLINLVTSK